MNSKKKMLKMLRTLVAAGLAYAVNYGILLVLTPYITRNVGTEAYGFVSLAKQFAQYAVIITTALNTYATRYISVAYHKNDYSKANMYFSSVFWGDIILVSVIFAASILGIIWLDKIIYIPAEIISDVKILFFFMFLNLWVSTAFSVFGCAAYIQNKLDITGLFKTLSYIVNMIVLVLLYRLFPAKVFYVGVGTVAATCVVGFSDFWITGKYTPGLRVKRKNYSFAAVRRLVMDGCWASLNSVGDMLNNGLDLLVCNQMLSSLAMGQLAIAKTMHTIVQSLYMIVDQAFIPMFLKSYADNDKKRLLSELKLSMKVSGLLANIMFAGFFALGLSYYKLWIPEQDIQVIYKLTVITILTCIPSGGIHPLYYIYTLTVKKMIPCIVTIAGGILNVAGMYILIKYAGMGVYAVAWTTAAVMAVINFVTNPLYMAHVLDLPLGTFYPPILRNVLSCGILVLVYRCFSHFYTPASWGGLIVCIAVYALAGVPIHLLVVCSRDEWNKITGVLKNRMNKR